MWLLDWPLAWLRAVGRQSTRIAGFLQYVPPSFLVPMLLGGGP